MIDSIFEHVNNTTQISIILECRIDILNVNHKKISMLGHAVPLNLITKLSQIGIRCSGTRKCSQRYEIDHFC